MLRLFQGEIENIENMPVREIYKPLIAAALPAVVGATVAGLAGWEMPLSEAQLLIGSGAWGTLVGFGVGLGAQPQWLLPTCCPLVEAWSVARWGWRFGDWPSLAQARSRCGTAPCCGAPTWVRCRGPT